ncbi:hypothetical protein V8B97DRAFT_2022103 [Scleroderma yunnanense]
MQQTSPPTESLQHRADIAKLLSPLRRVRPRVPFWNLAAHRIPTLWTLYRGLLRHVEHENIRHQIRTLFRENRQITSGQATKEQLQQGHKWLDVLKRARAGDTRLQAILDRVDRIVAVKREEEKWRACIHQVFNEEAHARVRPIFKGSFIRQTLYNRLLPRIIPQPENIGGIIRWRRNARERRLENKDELHRWIDDLRKEARFERELCAHEQGPHKMEFLGNALNEWVQPLQDKLGITEDSLLRDIERLHAPYPRKLLFQAKQARQRKLANKTRQKEREARGLYCLSTLKRMRRGPPTHILAKMTPEQRRLYRIAQGPAEGGYTAAVKVSLGMKLRSPSLWKLEGGQEENQAMLEAMEHKISSENERRQHRGGDEREV